MSKFIRSLTRMGPGVLAGLTNLLLIGLFRWCANHQADPQIARRIFDTIPVCAEVCFLASAVYLLIGIRSVYRRRDWSILLAGLAGLALLALCRFIAGQGTMFLVED